MEGEKMEKKNVLTKLLAIAGTVLAWFTIALEVLFLVIRLVQSDRLLFVFPLVAPAGGLLLLWAAMRARSRRAIIGWGVAVAAGSPIAAFGLFMFTWIALGGTGNVDPPGIFWLLMVLLLLAYTLAVVAMGVEGVLLLRDLFKTEETRAA
jgi:hypothetical protein